MRNFGLLLTLFSATAMQAWADGEADTFHADYYPQLATPQNRLQAEHNHEKESSHDNLDTRALPPGIYDEEPEGLPEGYLCIDRIVNIDQVVYDEELQCHHVKQKSCFQQVQTLYKQATVEECKEIFKKDCFYQYVDVAKKQKVKICQDNFSRNCSATGPKVCTLKRHTVCETSYPEHELVEDAANCIEMTVPWCEPDLDGNQVCVDVPKQNCTIEKVNVVKVTPFTDCKQVEFEVCGSEKCPIEKGPRVCRDEEKTVVTEVPEETCDIVPKKECNDVVKVIPSLTTVDHCEDIPKEVCTKVRINPRKESKPHKKKWCGKRSDILAASNGQQFFPDIEF